MKKQTRFSDILINGIFVNKRPKYIRCVSWDEDQTVCPLDDVCTDKEEFRAEFCDGSSICVYFEVIE